MIVIVAPFPTEENERNGYLQRINSIDQSLKDVKRVYLEIAFTENLFVRNKKYSDILEVYKLNLFIHFPLIISLAIKAKRIYVHNIINGFKILPLYFLKPIYTDLHGLGPEEAQMMGKRIKSWVHSITEFIAVKWSQRVIVVTQNMSSYIQKKYSKTKIKFILIPIFNKVFSKPILPKKEIKGKPLVIYSGGVDSWQNVEKMLEAVRRLNDRFDFLFLVNNIEALEMQFQDKALMQKVSIKSAPRNAIARYYDMADFGLLLREDNYVNQVACPTKLIEYINCGIIPILLQPNVGDFKDLGLRCVLLNELYDEGCLGTLDLDQMRFDNLAVIKKLERAFESGLSCLREELLLS